MPEDPVNEDVVFNILLAVREEQRSAVSAALLREIYELQRKHQFEDDRDPVLFGVRRAVEAEAEKLSGEESGS